MGVPKRRLSTLHGRRGLTQKTTNYNIFSIFSFKCGVIILVTLGAGLAGVPLAAWTTGFALLQNVHTGRRAHPFSFPEDMSAGA